MSNMTPTPQADLFTAMTEATTPQPVRIETATNDFEGADGKTYTATITTEYLANGVTRSRTEWAERPASGVGIVPAGGVVSNTAPADEVAQEPAQPEPMEITEALEDLRTEFLAKYAEDLADHVEAQRAEYRARGGAMDVAAWEIYKITGMEHVFSRLQIGAEPSKVGDVFMRSGSRNGVNQLPENCQQFAHDYMSAEEKRREIMRRLDRIGYGVGNRNASPEKVQKMAAAAWAKRLATLEKGIERNGVELATAKVTGYSANGGDYVLFIADAQGNGVHARSILAGGAGTCVRLHLRFICT